MDVLDDDLVDLGDLDLLGQCDLLMGEMGHDGPLPRFTSDDF